MLRTNYYDLLTLIAVQIPDCLSSDDLMSSTSSIPEVLIPDRSLNVVMSSTCMPSCSATPEIRVAQEASSDYLVTDCQDGSENTALQIHGGDVRHCLDHRSSSTAGDCRSQSPSPNTARRLSAPVSAGSPSHLRRCSVEEPYVFSMAQAAAAVASQVHRSPAPLIMTSSPSSPNCQKNPNSQTTPMPPLSDNGPTASGRDGGPISSSPCWEFVAIGCTSFGSSGNATCHVIRRPSPCSTTLADKRAVSLQSYSYPDDSGQCEMTECVSVDPGRVKGHSRWSSRSFSLSLPQQCAELTPPRCSSSSDSSKKSNSTTVSHNLSADEDKRMKLVTASTYGNDFLRLPAGWATLDEVDNRWTLDEVTGLPRRRHSVASSRSPTPGQLESIAEETPGSGNSNASGQCLLQPKGSIRRYSIPETMSASRAAAVASSKKTGVWLKTCVVETRRLTSYGVVWGLTCWEWNWVMVNIGYIYYDNCTVVIYFCVFHPTLTQSCDNPVLTMVKKMTQSRNSSPQFLLCSLLRSL